MVVEHEILTLWNENASKIKKIKALWTKAELVLSEFEMTFVAYTVILNWMAITALT